MHTDKNTDKTKLMISWKKHSELESLKERMIRLKFYLNKADLYSFWISAWQTGESCGYTSGGGPGLSDKGIDVPVN
ncbi:hypothetical protein SFC43_02715 [Bacteroides sp. CR5/BHMF/2]|nr:hypothetical protein [Bacteroides sp. CR5/BHMF/2]